MDIGNQTYYFYDTQTTFFVVDTFLKSKLEIRKGKISRSLSYLLVRDNGVYVPETEGEIVSFLNQW